MVCCFLGFVIGAMASTVIKKLTKSYIMIFCCLMLIFAIIVFLYKEAVLLKDFKKLNVNLIKLYKTNCSNFL